MKQVEFFFDVGSPYSYLAYHQLPKIAQAKGAEIVWRPMLLGGVNVDPRLVSVFFDVAPRAT